MQEVLLNNGNGFILPDVYTDPFYSYYQEQQSWRTPSYDPQHIAKYKSGWKNFLISLTECLVDSMLIL